MTRRSPNEILDDLISRYPNLLVCKEDILSAFAILKDCFSNKHKLLVCGNGGSSSDADHIVGELMKTFKKDRPCQNKFIDEMTNIDKELGNELSKVLQQGLPSISLSNHNSLNTALLNDVNNGGLYTFAQQTYVYGNEKDALLAISTSGNSRNVLRAVIVAKAKRMKVIALTGDGGGKINQFADVTIKAPAKETYIVQEYHLPIYHCLCLMLEEFFFK